MGKLHISMSSLCLNNFPCASVCIVMYVPDNSHLQNKPRFLKYTDQDEHSPNEYFINKYE